MAVIPNTNGSSPGSFKDNARAVRDDAERGRQELRALGSSGAEIGQDLKELGRLEAELAKASRRWRTTPTGRSGWPRSPQQVRSSWSPPSLASWLAARSRSSRPPRNAQSRPSRRTSHGFAD